MSYEDQLIREATGQSPDFMEPEPEETNDSNETREAYVFQELTGLWHYCDNALPYLDARGTGYSSKHKAFKAARESGFKIRQHL